MPEELKKIELDPSPASVVPPSAPRGHMPWKLLLLPVGIVAAILLLVGVMLLPFGGVLTKVKDVAESGKKAAVAIKSQDLVGTKNALAQTRTKLKILADEYNKVKPLKLVPILGWYLTDGEHGIAAAFAGLDAADKAIEALEPNADLLGLKGKSSFVQGSADERIQTAVKTMTALLPKVNEIAVSVDKLRTEIDAIDPSRYPEKIGKTNVRQQLVATKEVIQNAANLFVNAQQLLLNLPRLLGEPDDRRYLVIFQNDKELRPTGGFMTAYAQFRFAHGKAIMEKADDIYALDNALKKKFPAPREILTFHKGVYNLNIRDSNLSPDFKASMQQFETLYDNVGGKEHIDGIITIDTHVFVESLKILGPMFVYGREFSAVTDKRCDCPKAIYELEDYSTRPVGYVREARKDVIGVLLRDLMQKALGVSPSKYWGQLFQMLLTEINEKHVLAYMHEPAAQKAIESFNLGGRIMTASETATLLKYKEGSGWDYIHVNNSNMAGAKSNMFTSQKVTKDVTVGSDGTVTTKLTIDYKNPYAGSDCGLESGGLCLNAPLRDWIRIYAPLGSKLIDSKGAISPKENKVVPMDTYEDLTKTVFEGFLIINPLGTAKLELTFTSPVKSADGKYRLLIQKQPGTDKDEWTIKLNGKERKKFPLQTDTELVL